MLFRRAFLFLLLFSLLVPSGVALFPQSTSAAAFGLVPCALDNDDPTTTTWDERGPCTLCHFLIGMQKIVTLLRNIMTACAIAVIVAMAIVYITSAGNESQMSFAKEGIKWSLIGFVVILLAWVVVNFLFNLPIFAANGLVKGSGWDTFSCNTSSQVNWSSGSGPASGIGNATGGVGSGTPGRGENPGTGGGGDDNPGTGGGDNPGPEVPEGKCGATHYNCDKGTASDMKELSDRWEWLCKQDYAQKYCFERFEGCGDGRVSGVNQYGNPETCDEGGRNGFCGDSGVTCDVNACTRCDGSGPPAPVPLSCGPSHGSSSAPVLPLCLGDGAIASSVTTSAVGSATRYDWTCTKSGLVGSLACSSGATSSGGNPTATCGPAQSRSWLNPPTESDGLCATGSLTIYGVTPLVHAVTGEPLWYWSCQVGTGVATSCYAPRITAGSSIGNASCGTLSIYPDGKIIASSYCSKGHVFPASDDCTANADQTMLNCNWICAANDSAYTVPCSGSVPIP